MQTIAAIFALLPLIVMPLHLLTQPQTWLSLWWALPAVALIATGLAVKSRPYRMTGLIALLLPLGRLFVYDIRDPLYRIVVFALVAVLLLLIGYVYNRILENEKRRNQTQLTGEEPETPDAG